MTLRMAFVVWGAALAALAGNVCTWTGTGGTDKFSTAANWDVPPVSGNGDLLYFPVGTTEAASELAVENDLDGLSVAAIRTHGHNNSVFTLNGKEITLTGAATAVCPEITAATVVSNYTALVLNAPLAVTRSGENAYMRFYGQKLTVNAKITAANVANLYLYGRLSCTYAPYIGEAERYPSNSLGSVFNAPIEAPETIVHENIGQNCGAQEVTFNAKVTAKELHVSSQTRDSIAYLKCAGNRIGRVGFVADAIYLDVDEALDADTVICDTKAGNGWMWSGLYYLQEGTHQTINRIEGNGDYLSNANFVNSYNLRCRTSGGSAEMEMRGTADATTYMRVRDKVSLIWNPTGDFKQTFRDRVSDTVGPIIVKGGTFAVAGTAAFSSVPSISVLAGAKLEISSTNSASPAFGSLEFLQLGAGAQCVVGADANPFAANKVLASLGQNAKFTVAAGVDVKLSMLSVAGARLADGVYTAGADTPWLEGAGTVTVAQGTGTTGATYWLSGVDGDWDAAGNWSAGVPTATSTAIIKGNGSAQIRLSDTSVLPAKLAVGNIGGTTTILLSECERAWNPTELKLMAGGRVEVPAGAKLVSNDATGTVLLDGGEIFISGGEMVYTNFQGTFTVQGALTSTGRVFLANGVFQFSHKSKNDKYRLLVKNYGEIYATNGVVVAPETYAPFFQKGGRLIFTGDSKLQYGTAKALELVFGEGETLFEGNSVFHGLTSGSRFHVTSYSSNIEARVIFRGNAFVAGTQMEDLNVGSPNGAHSILEFDSDKCHEARFGYRFNLGCDAYKGELRMKRGYVAVGYRGLNVGGSSGNQWNKQMTGKGAYGALRMQGGALKLHGSGAVKEGAFTGFRLGDGGPAYLARDLKGAFTGFADVSGGAITNTASVVIGGGRGVGTYTQTGGSFINESQVAPFIVGCAGGTGSLTLGGGTIKTSADAFVGGALTNQIPEGHVLDSYYNGNYPVDQHDAVGTFTVTGGTFRCVKNLYLGCDGVGTLAMAGTDYGFTVGGDLVLSNTTVAAAESVPGWTTAAKLSFTFDPEEGLAPVTVAGKVVNTEGTTLRVDMGAYKGKKSKFPLLKAAAFEGAPFNQVEIVGDKAHKARIMMDATSLSVSIMRGTMFIMR